LICKSLQDTAKNPSFASGPSFLFLRCSNISIYYPVFEPSKSLSSHQNQAFLEVPYTESSPIAHRVPVPRLAAPAGDVFARRA
jgi:hypothetical protein